MTRDQVDGAVRQLGAEPRALIELSVVRGMSDDELAGYLGIDAELVRERRESTLDELAAESGDASAEGRMQVVRHLQGDVEPEAATGPKAEPAPEPEPEPEAGPEPRRSKLGPLLVGLALVVVAAILVVSLRHGDDSASEDTGTPVPTTRAGATLRPLTGGPARGTARLVDQGGAVHLKLAVRGLPTPSSGGYVIWLYDSVTDARSLTGSLKGTFSIDTPLPPGYKRYRFLDVSREPADGNRNHSGQSVLRVPLTSVKVAGRN